MGGHGAGEQAASVRVGTRQHGDGFGTVRLVAAIGIVMLHAMPITGHRDNGWGEGQTYYHFGTLTVAAFMAMSGFFVMKTWERDPHLARFWVRRALRIVPGLFVVLTLTAFALGPLVTTLAPSEYFARPETWTYVVRNILLFPQQYSLPGVFTDNPYPAAVNGSLWCLPVEVLGYAIVTLVGMSGIARHRMMIFVAPVMFGTLLVLNVNGVVRLPHTILMLLTNPLMQYLAIYTMGIAAWLYRDRLPLSWWGVLACVAIELASFHTPLRDITRAVTVPYAVLTIGTKLPKRLCLPRWLTVASFGVFIYGFPVEQTTAFLGADEAWQVMVLAVPISVVLGLLSWHLVENPALRLRAALTERGADRTAGLETIRTAPVDRIDPPTVELPRVPAVAPASGRSSVQHQSVRARSHDTPTIELPSARPHQAHRYAPGALPPTGTAESSHIVSRPPHVRLPRKG